MECGRREEKERYPLSFIQLWEPKNIKSSKPFPLAYSPTFWGKKTLNEIKKNMSECIACSQDKYCFMKLLFRGICVSAGSQRMMNFFLWIGVQKVGKPLIKRSPKNPCSAATKLPKHLQKPFNDTENYLLLGQGVVGKTTKSSIQCDSTT